MLGGGGGGLGGPGGLGVAVLSLGDQSRLTSPQDGGTVQGDHSGRKKIPPVDLVPKAPAASGPLLCRATAINVTRKGIIGRAE